MTDDPAELALSIGDLLMRAGVVTIEALEDSVNLAIKMRVPLQRVLTMHGYLSEQGVQSAILLQSMIDSKTLGLESAVKALEMVGQGMDVETALRKMSPGMKTSKGKLSNKLGDLLRASGIVTSKQLEQGLLNSLDTGLPLGMVLVNQGVAPRALISYGLVALRLVESNQLNRDIAVQALRVARLKSISLAEALVESNFDPSQLPEQTSFGHLLVMSGFITEVQLLSAQELELEGNKQLADVLLQCAYGSEIVISAAQHLMQMVDDGSLLTYQAALLLKRLRGAKTPDEMTEILSSLDEEEELDIGTFEVTDLLQQAGFISSNEIKEATTVALLAKTSLLKTLIEAGNLKPVMAAAATDCKEVLEAGLLSEEQGVMAMVYSAENEISFQETLDRFGWSSSLTPE